MLFSFFLALCTISHILHTYIKDSMVTHKKYKNNLIEMKYNFLIKAIQDDKISDKQLNFIIEYVDLSSIINLDVINSHNNKIYRHPLSVVIAENLTDKAKIILNYRKENINNIKDIGDSYTKTAILNKNIELL